MIFASSDFSDSLYWPMLEVVYTPAAAQQCQTVFVTDGNGQDAIVTTFEPALSYPNHEEFGSMSWTCNGDPCWQRGLMQFDLSFIPSNAVVDSAFWIYMQILPVRLYRPCKAQMPVTSRELPLHGVPIP